MALAKLLSVIIPGRNEQFMAKTVQNVLDAIRGDTEIIAVLDGYWADPPIPTDKRVIIVHHEEIIGQRGGTNEGARISQAKYVAKLDAHCAVDEGFDVKLAEPYETGEITMDTTTIPRMYNLHAFDWMCDQCGHRVYQGPRPEKCEKCGHDKNHMEIVWQPRRSRRTDYARIDTDIRFQYWTDYDRKVNPAARHKEIDDLMCSVGACFFMPRQRFFDLGGMDEGHGSWGQFGVELACKAWLSGGRQVVNKRTWFSHMFRTNSHGFSFPYHISGNEVERARRYSQRLWKRRRWPLATRRLSWLVRKFAPVPGWDGPDPKKEARDAEKQES